MFPIRAYKQPLGAPTCLCRLPGRQHHRKVNILTNGVPVVYAFRRKCRLTRHIYINTKVLTDESSDINVREAVDAAENLTANPRATTTYQGP